MFSTRLSRELIVGCAWAYFRQNSAARYIFKKRVEQAFSLIPKKRYGYALDAGTGIGFFLPALSSIADDVVGVDIAPVLPYTRTMLRHRHIDNVVLSNADLYNLPFSSSAFDLIVCLSVIEHVPDPKTVFSEIDRILQDSGVMIVGYPLEHALYKFFEKLSRWYKYVKLRNKIKKLKTDKRFHPHVSSYRQIEESLDNIFRIDARKDVGVFGIPLYRVLRLVKVNTG
jgi:ubiquinone/menaquinone biosynthesis C-methylase UbiE